MHIRQLLYVQQRTLKCKGKRENHTTEFRKWRNQIGIFHWRILKINGPQTSRETSDTRCLPVAGT